MIEHNHKQFRGGLYGSGALLVQLQESVVKLGHYLAAEQIILVDVTGDVMASSQNHQTTLQLSSLVASDIALGQEILTLTGYKRPEFLTLRECGDLFIITAPIGAQAAVLVQINQAVSFTWILRQVKLAVQQLAETIDCLSVPTAEELSATADSLSDQIDKELDAIWLE